VSTILKLGTKRLNDASSHFPQTTPLRSRSSLVRGNNGLERIRIELALKESP